MIDCPTLVNPSFTGLSSLLEVGARWMSDCRTLENPSFNGLSRLKKVSCHWRYDCTALADTTFDGLSSLENVGPHGHKKVQEYFIEQIQYYNGTADHTRRFD